MKLAFALVFGLVLAGLSLAASYDVCWPRYVSCSESCCTNAGGSLTEDEDGVTCHASSSQLTQYHTCDNSCVVLELNCLAPGSDCDTQYTNCINSCGSTSSSCVNSCSDPAFDCADAAMAGNNSSSGGCCGAFVLLGFTGLGGLLFAAKR